MNWDAATRAQLQAKYPRTHKGLASLVMAMEYAAHNMGKRTWYGADKGKKAYHKIGAGLRDTVQALHAEHLVSHDSPPDQVLSKLVTMLGLFQQAYPNWPAAYGFAQRFFATEPELTFAVINFVRAR
jgi:hypothetical protein